MHDKITRRHVSIGAAIERAAAELPEGYDLMIEVEAERKLFEADAEPYGFDLTRHQCAAPEPWAEYADPETGYRWSGWLAARAIPSNAKLTGLARTRDEH